MPEHRSQNELNVQDKDRQQSQREQAGPALIKLNPGLLLDPPRPGEDRHDDGKTKKCLRQSGMGR